MMQASTISVGACAHIRRVQSTMKNKKWCRELSLFLVMTMLLCISGFAVDADIPSEAAEAQTVDSTELTEDAAVAMLAADSNHYPIVLVHGLFGWGGREIAGLNYWGGTSSLRDILNNAGYEVYTPSIGPVASNWDRACELYAYLVGGTVDYGQYHSAQNGHARYGRTFPGVLPELNDADSALKIHLVGHSMGGETIRMLAQLLENGDPDEVNATTDGSISPLFTGECRHWIESITTLCTPHDGSQYDTKVYNNIEPLAHQFVGILAAATGMNINEQNFGLDFKLDQWGLTRQANEDYASYFTRVMNSSIWEEHVSDLSIYDLDVDGAAVLNGYAKAQDDIYYFSVACSDTYRSPVYPHNYLPYADINPMMVKSATYMGSHVNYAVGHVQVTPDWWENDGIVSVRSAIAPHENSTDKCSLNYGTASDGAMVFQAGTQKGVWNYIEKIDRTDHINMVGQFQNKAMLQTKFFELAKMLESIPVESGSDDSSSSAQPHVCPGAQFTDMPKYTDWAHAGLDYCIANGMLNGTSATTIEPGSAATRAQLVTILWRQNGCPTPTRTCSFTDLTQSWYKDAVAWAAETGIVTGRDAVTFDPTAPITRQEMATMLYRYATFAKLDTSAKGDLSVFPDENQVLDYAVDAMAWANGAGLITGNVVNDVTCLDPLGNANRAQVATILMRFCENVAK